MTGVHDKKARLLSCDFLGKLDTPLCKAVGFLVYTRKSLDYRRKLWLQVRLWHMLKHRSDPGTGLVLVLHPMLIGTMITSPIVKAIDKGT